MPKTRTKETNAVLDNHLAAAQRGDLEGVLKRTARPECNERDRKSVQGWEYF